MSRLHRGEILTRQRWGRFYKGKCKEPFSRTDVRSLRASLLMREIADQERVKIDKETINHNQQP